jgi:rubrerythrin
MQFRQDTSSGLVRKMLKADIIGEHDAIRQYNSHINLISDAKIRTKLEHIRDQELHHAKELEIMLRNIGQ